MILISREPERRNTTQAVVPKSAIRHTQDRLPTDEPRAGQPVLPGRGAALRARLDDPHFESHLRQLGQRLRRRRRTHCSDARSDPPSLDNRQRSIGQATVSGSGGSGSFIFYETYGGDDSLSAFNVNLYDNSCVPVYGEIDIEGSRDSEVIAFMRALMNRAHAKAELRLGSAPRACELRADRVRNHVRISAHRC